MKSIFAMIAMIFIIFVAVDGGWAQQPSPGDPPPPVSTAPQLSPDDMAKLVGPIALYPDALVGLILPASTVPTDIVLAARYLRDNKDATQIDSQSWDPSVKGLARYPDVVQMMSENLDWTNQLGAAVIAQKSDVMAAIQAQRAKAQALGNLPSTPQQQVVVEKDVIQIVPADPQVIYVPTYNPAVVYTQPPPPAAPWITFGAGLAVGFWLGNNCDWYHHDIYVNNYGPRWHGGPPPGGWGHPWPPGPPPNGSHSWKPNPNRPPPHPSYHPGRPGGAGQLPGVRPGPPGGHATRAGNAGRPGTNAPGLKPGGKPEWNGNKAPGRQQGLENRKSRQPEESNAARREQRSKPAGISPSPGNKPSLNRGAAEGRHRLRH